MKQLTLTILSLMVGFSTFAGTTASSGKNFFLIGSDNQIYRRQLNSDWEKFYAQLPDGAVPKVIIGGVIEVPTQATGGFEMGGMVNHESLLVIAEDGHNYMIAIDKQAEFQLSRALLPKGVTPKE